MRFKRWQTPPPFPLQCSWKANQCFVHSGCSTHLQSNSEVQAPSQGKWPMWCLVRHYADPVALCSVKHIVRYDYRGGMSVRWKGHISVVIGVVSGVKTFKVQSPDAPPYQNRCWISSVELPISRKHSLSVHGYEQFSEASWLCPIYCQLIIYLKSQIPDCDVRNRLFMEGFNFRTVDKHNTCTHKLS